jgi:hypothetical protein
MKTILAIGVICGLSARPDALADQTTANSLGTQPRKTAVEANDSQGAETAKPITVHLASGRTFTATVDPKTDRAKLWLRWENGSAVVQRPIRWDRVVRAEVAGQELSGEEMHQLVEAVEHQPERPAEAAGKEAEPLKRVSSGVPRGTARAVSVPRQRPRVRSLAIDARVANWDGDVEVDGLLIHVYPMDADGQVVPVRGSLAVDLTASRQRWGALSGPFAVLGRWTRRVRSEDFGPRGAVYRLPFKAVHPEFDLAVNSHGAVHARLSVPGHGTFETTDSTVRIRPASAIRDQWQHATGRRFFPQERTGRGGR